MAHTCPIGDCPATVPDTQLMCRIHWRDVPRDLQRELYAAWDGGRGTGTDRHQEAMKACIAAAGGSTDAVGT